jgi:hypothetical protein
MGGLGRWLLSVLSLAAFVVALPASSSGAPVAGTAHLSGPTSSVGSPVYASIDLGTSFAAIDGVCFDFSFQGDLLDPGDWLSLTPLNLLPSFSGGGFGNTGSTPQAERMICTPNSLGYGPYDSIFFDGAENNIEIGMSSGSVTIASLVISVIGVPGSPPPAPSAPDLTSATDSGSSSTDNVTNSPTFTFDGTAVPGAGVTIYADGNLFGATAADPGSGAWTLSAPLREGNSTYLAVLTDPAGKLISSPSAGLVVTGDVNPPTIGVWFPTGTEVDATSPAGAAVAYEVTGTDWLDPSPVAGCTPPSGATFPIGSTIMNCVATDAAGNSAYDTPTVYVRGAYEQIGDLISTVDGMSTKLVASLRDKLVPAQRFIGAAKTKQACYELDSFLKQVAHESGHFITADDAAYLIDTGARIEAVLGC